MRIEIDIRDNIPPETALEAVKVVVKAGRISKGEKGKMYYCWLSTFSTDIGEICVSIRQYRKNDCFVVYKGNNHGNAR